MRSGKLDKTITIQTFGLSYNEDNEPIQGWTDLGTYRAQIVQASNEEFFQSGNINQQTGTVFKTRFIENVKLTSRVVFQAKNFNIIEVRELGRRNGLEIRAAAAIEGT